MINELNNIFANIHPLIKIKFTEIGDATFKVEMGLYKEDGKFRTSSSQNVVFLFLHDPRFLNLAKGSALSLAKIFAESDDIDRTFENIPPSDIIVDSLLEDQTLNSIEDFSSRLDTIAKRRDLTAQQYIFKKATDLGIPVNTCHSDEKKALKDIGLFELAYVLPSIKELSKTIQVLVNNPIFWPLLVKLIKNWAGASQWSCQEAWAGGPLLEELLAFGTYKLLSKTDAKNQTWWGDLEITVDLSLDLNEKDLNKAQFELN